MSTTPDMAPARRKSSAGETSSSTGSNPSATSGASIDKSREDELEAQVAQLRSDLQAIGETLKKLTTEKASEAKDLAQTELSHLKRKGEHLVADAQNQAEEHEQQLKDTIREKPLTAVATALGIGFVLALVTRH